MPKPSWENLDEFLETDDEGGFASVAVISLFAGGTRQVKGIFEDPFEQASVGEFVQDTAAPSFTCKESDLVGVRRKGTLTIGGKVYDILTNPQPDGTGIAMLKLARQIGLAFTDAQKAAQTPNFRTSESILDTDVNT